MKRCLGAFFQAGGAKALEPVLRDLADRCDLDVIGREPAVRFLGARGIDTSLVTPEAVKKDAVSRYDFVLTDTINMSRSEDAPLLGRLWESAAIAGIPTLAFVDSWWGYDNRFVDPAGEGREILPDTIAVVDEVARQGMIEVGHDDDNLSILGSPHLDELRAMRSEADVRRQRFRKQQGYGDEFVCLYVSQPLENALQGGLEQWGFNELTTLAALGEQISLLPREFRDTMNLVILPHPEDDVDGLKKAAQDIAVPCTVVRDADPLDAVCGADLVTGMFSILLTEAVLMGRPVLSIQLGLKREDMLVTNMVGATLCARSEEQLNEMFVKQVCDPDYRAAALERQDRFSVVGDSRQRWNDSLNQMGI